MSDGNSSNNSVGIVAILAILVLVVVGVWFFYGRSANAPTTKQTTTAPDDPGIHVKIDLPDSVVIK